MSAEIYAFLHDMNLLNEVRESLELIIDMIYYKYGKPNPHTTGRMQEKTILRFKIVRSSRQKLFAKQFGNSFNISGRVLGILISA